MNTAPMSRRDVWLTIALAIARDGLPTPTEQKANTTSDGQPMLLIEVETEADAKAWAACLGIEIKPYHVRDTGISTWGEFAGWRTNVHWTAPEPSPLADEVIAAIEAPAEPLITSAPELAAARGFAWPADACGCCGAQVIDGFCTGTSVCQDGTCVRQVGAEPQATTGGEPR